MGMAASQARFLGLTARKSNVEYQGQQVNQQRTALANESANLYNQMMDLTVPTPPSTNDFYKTTYELEDSAAPYATGNYTIESFTKTYAANNEYVVTLGYQTQENIAQDFPVLANKTTSSNEKYNEIEYDQYKFNLTDSAAKYNFTLTFNDNEDLLNAYTGVKNQNEQNTLAVTEGVIYKVDPDRELAGKKECCTENTQYYFYQLGGNTFFLTEDEIAMLKENTENNNPITYKKATTKTNSQTTQVKATMEKSSTGRFSSIKIDKNGEYPADLYGAEFSLNVKNVFDQDGYDNAMNDYTYQKDLYEKAISDINAKTEKIQKQDQNLELRLNQLNTEQNAIKTEMEAVDKVISDNVEKTFNTFG